MMGAEWRAGRATARFSWAPRSFFATEAVVRAEVKAVN